MSPSSTESKVPVLKASIEADTIRITQNDLVSLAIAEREQQLEDEQKSISEKMGAIQAESNSLAEEIGKGLRKISKELAHKSLDKALKILSSVGEYRFSISKDDDDMLKGLEVSDLPKSAVVVVNVGGSGSGPKYSSSTDFEIPISIDIPDSLIAMSRKLSEKHDEFNKLAQRVAVIMNQLRNVDRMARKANAAMIKKAIANSPDIRRFVPAITDGK